MKQLVRVLSGHSLKHTHKLSPFIHKNLYIYNYMYTTQVHPQCLATLANASGVVCSRLTRVNLGRIARMSLRVYERWGKMVVGNTISGTYKPLCYRD